MEHADADAKQMKSISCFMVAYFNLSLVIVDGIHVEGSNSLLFYYLPLMSDIGIENWDK